MEKKWFFVGLYGRHQDSNATGSFWKHDAFFDNESDLLFRILNFKRGSTLTSITIEELQPTGVRLPRKDLVKKVSNTKGSFV